MTIWHRSGGSSCPPDEHLARIVPPGTKFVKEITCIPLTVPLYGLIMRLKQNPGVVRGKILTQLNRETVSYMTGLVKNLTNNSGEAGGWWFGFPNEH